MAQSHDIHNKNHHSWRPKLPMSNENTFTGHFHLNLPDENHSVYIEQEIREDMGKI